MLEVESVLADLALCDVLVVMMLRCLESASRA